MEKSELSRRCFLKGFGAIAAGAAAAGVVGCKKEEEPPAKPSWMPEAWDYETDVLVVGCGGAGIAAGITAAKEGLGDCLIIEAAPEGFEGGNTRVSGQSIFCPDTVDGAIEFQTNLNGPYEVDKDIMRAWAENICANVDWLAELGIEMKQSKFGKEWPEVGGAEHERIFLAGGTVGNSALWNAIWEVATNLGVKVMHDTRAMELIHNPETKEVFGVKAEVAGAPKYFKASKAVILSCGGFENNPEMIATYSQIGHYDILPGGTPFNRGDGHRMVAALGAKMWHMNNFALANGYHFPNGKEQEERLRSSVSFGNKEFIYVGADAKRFANEEVIGMDGGGFGGNLARHGKYPYGGCSTNLMRPVPSYAIFDQSCYDAKSVVYTSNSGTWCGTFNLAKYATNEDLLSAGILQKADTVEELAKKLGLNADVLAKTVADYNAGAAAGTDPEFHRGEPIANPFEFMRGDSADYSKPAIAAFPLVPLTGPFYGMKLYQGIINTQGGPKHSAKCEVLDVNEKPIPRLYAAGEFGAIYGYNYNAGGNVGGALSTGRLAARNASALTAWDAVEEEAK